MRKSTIFIVFFLVSICLANGATGNTGGEPDKFGTIASASNTIVRLKEDNKGSSAILVANDLILTAAHSLYGYDANYKPVHIAVILQEKEYKLEVVENGRFNPKLGQMADWALLKIQANTKAFNHIAIAKLATSKTMARILKELGDFTGNRNGAVIWSASYPMFTIRPYPIEGSDGKSIFLSRGHMKSESAYKQHILFAAHNSQIYDDRLSASPPTFDVDIQKSWPKLKNNSNFKGIYQLYKLYKADGDPILHHTADYSNGSSGGGFFDEETGELIGIVTMGTHLGPRYVTHYGIGDLYRIDAICRQSKVLAAYGLCKE